MKPADNCPWYAVKVGESFVVPNVSIQVAACRARRRNEVRGYIYRLRTINGGVRVQRVA